MAGVLNDRGSGYNEPRAGSKDSQTRSSVADFVLNYDRRKIKR